jgi:histidinol phosphatase-like enzyme (inositol monophosphatase family)
MLHHSDPISARLAAALQFVHEAGELTLEYFQQDQLAVDRKADDSPVTQADRNAEQLMRREIERVFPKDAIIGEEYGEQPGTSGYTWILDPIDGTKSFIGGVPLYSQLVGILAGDESVAGIIAVPALQECVFGAIGQGAWWRKRNRPPQPARVSQRSRLAEGIFLTSQVDSFQQRGAADAYARLERTAYVSRTWGDGYGYLLIATGRAEVMVDPIMNLWDAAAIRPVVVEAGGTFTDWQGEPTIRSGEGIATNGLVLEEVLQITRAFPKRT